jgi:hypothetical protein
MVRGQQYVECALDRCGDVTHVDEGTVLPTRLPFRRRVRAAQLLDPRVDLGAPDPNRAQGDGRDPRPRGCALAQILGDALRLGLEQICAYPRRRWRGSVAMLKTCP